MSKSQAGIVDQVRLGPAAAQLKAKLKPAKWRKLVHAAHKQGYTVQGALSDADPALKERTHASLVKQAKHTVKVSYRPIQKEVTQEENHVNALDAKRASDDKSYREWLLGKTGTLQAQARAADSALLDRQREIGQQSLDAWDGAHAEAAQNVAALPGNVSDPSQSNALNFSAASQHAADLVAGNRQQTSDMVGSNESAMQLAQAAILAGASASRAQHTGDTAASLTKIADERAKIHASKAGDTVKEVSRLLDNEVSKAQNNRDYAAAASKLHIEDKKLDLSFLKEKHDYGLGKATLNLSKWKEQNTQAWRKASTQLGYDKLVAQDGRSAADRALRKWIARHNKKDGTTDKGRTITAGERKDAQKNYRGAETARDQLKTKSRAKLLKEGFDVVVLDIAADLIANKGKLSPLGYKKAKNLGIAHYYARVDQGAGSKGSSDAAQK